MLNEVKAKSVKVTANLYNKMSDRRPCFLFQLIVIFLYREIPMPEVRLHASLNNYREYTLLYQCTALLLF